MYTRYQVGKELKEKILKKLSLEAIGKWAYSVYFICLGERDYNDADLDDLLLTLTTMEEGPEFYFTYEELNKIADRLISNEVKIN